MPKLLHARPKDPARNARSASSPPARHAPGDWIQRARMLTRSWERSTHPPAGAMTVCADQLGAVIPRAAGWSPDGHRSKAPLEYGRGFDKVWVYGGLGCATARSSPAPPLAAQHRRLEAAAVGDRTGQPDRATWRWSATTCPATTAGRCGRGWSTTPRLRQGFIPRGCAG
jgi:hypothetical protein